MIVNIIFIFLSSKYDEHHMISKHVYSLGKQMTPLLKGENIVLRPMRIEDAPFIQKHFPHWEIVKNLSLQVPWPYPPDGAENFLLHVVLPKMERGEMYGWAICEHETPDQLIGSISYCSTDPKELRRGFWLAREYHGRGYMTQAVYLVQDFLFFQCNLPALFFMNAVENIGSRRIKEKTGATYVGLVDFEHLSGGKDSEVWKITREEWTAFRKTT